MKQARVLADRYEVHETLGRGGMGEVFRATDRTDGSWVALKALLAHQCSDEALERLQREGEALRLLNHPNIVKGLGTFQEEGRTYLVMEFVPGGSLRQLLERQALSTERAVEIALDLCDALTRAHRLHIVHRDLKPDNVLIGADGAARLTDFGMAHLGEGRLLTGEGAALGTLPYMCPESCMGHPPGPGHDIWSLGVMLFELLTGQLPFDGPNPAAVLTAIMSKPLPDLEQLRPDLPVALIDLATRMLDKNPATRIGSVRQIGLELESLAPARAAAPSFCAIPEPPTRPTPTGPHLTAAQGFVGRQAELREVEQLLQTSPCLTLLGPGGIGKSRLALELVSRLGDRYPDGACFVALAPVDAPERIVVALAEAVGLSFAGPREPWDQLVDHLRDLRKLIVLDNFEHLVERGNQLVARLASALPSIRWLITSRVRLQLTQEALFEVHELSFPQPHDPPGRSYEAIEFFEAMVRRNLPGYRLDPADLEAVTRICQLVEGVPLGLELAAAWVRLLRPAEIAEEMERDLEVLESQACDVDDRHRSLRAAFDYSWRLLTPELQRTLQGLSVFRGGFTREAARQVTGAALGALLRLVDCSLVRRRSSGRFEMHEVVRQFAAAGLAASADQEALHQRHADFFAEFLWQRQQLLRRGGRSWIEIFREVEEDYENARAAWRYSLDHGRLANLGRCCDTLWIHLDFKGRVAEVSELVAPALARGQSVEDRLALGKLLTVQAMLTLDQALQIFPQALKELEAFPEEQATTLTYQAFVLHSSYGRSAEALALAQQAQSMHQQFGNIQGVAFALVIQALASQAQEALPLLEQALAIYRRLDSPHSLARFLSHQATLELTLERLEEARAHVGEGLPMAREVGDRLCQCKLLQLQADLDEKAGRLEDSWKANHEVLELASRLRLFSTQIRAAGRLARLLAHRGERRQGIEILAFLAEHPATVEAARVRLRSDLEGLLEPGEVAPPGRRQQLLEDVVTDLLSRHS